MFESTNLPPTIHLLQIPVPVTETIILSSRDAAMSCGSQMSAQTSSDAVMSPSEDQLPPQFPARATSDAVMSQSEDQSTPQPAVVFRSSESAMEGSSQKTVTQLSIKSFIPKTLDDSEDKPDRCFGSPIITLYAGPERAPFYVHQDVLCEASGYFREKFEGEDPADEDRKTFVNLPDDDPDIVHRFVTYMYRPRLRLFPDNDDPTAFEPTLSALARIYLLAVRFELPDLQFKANKEIFKRLDLETDESIQDLEEDKFRDDLGMRMGTIREVYTKTTSTYDPLRKTLVTNMARHWVCYSGNGGMLDEADGSESELSKFMEEVPRFAKDLLRYLRSSTPGKFVPPRDPSVKKRKWSGSVIALE